MSCPEQMVAFKQMVSVCLDHVRWEVSSIPKHLNIPLIQVL